MNRTVEAETKQLFEALARDGLAETTTVVLIGSAARDAMNSRSDIDVLRSVRRIAVRRQPCCQSVSTRTWSVSTFKT